MLATLKLSDPDKVSTQYAGYIRQAADHLLGLINGILDVSKIQAGKLAVEREPVTAAPILESCLLIIEAKARERDITVTSRSSPRYCRGSMSIRCGSSRFSSTSCAMR